MQLDGKNVLVVGLGRSGVAAARLCAARGAHVTVTDRKPAPELGAALAELPDGVARSLGGHDQQEFLSADLIVLSPGVPEFTELSEAQFSGVPVIGELELAYRFVQAPVIAVTGTNGKSTTTSLLGEMVRASGRPTFVGGNLGTPLCEAVGTAAAGPDGALVVEVSSFQLETVVTFHARVALLLNLSPDHLDRYATYSDYLAAKARIFERQTAGDFAVLNVNPGQETCAALAHGTRAQHRTFAVSRAPGVHGFIDGDCLVLEPPGGERETLSRNELALPGRHNAENALSALLAARAFGVPLATCREALRRFQGLPHRMQWVGERNDVRFYDDSKATNVGSVVGSLTGFERKVVLIAGGKHKGGDYGPMAEVLRDVARAVVLIGAATELIAAALEPSLPVVRAKTMDEAVRVAAGLARPGDAVVLSPACSSFDMFTNYVERGQVFAAAVRALCEEG